MFPIRPARSMPHLEFNNVIECPNLKIHITVVVNRATVFAREISKFHYKN